MSAASEKLGLHLRFMGKVNTESIYSSKTPIVHDLKMTQKSVLTRAELSKVTKCELHMPDKKCKLSMLVKHETFCLEGKHDRDKYLQY